MLKNITLSAEECDIEAARAKAREEHTTVNELFRTWIHDYAEQRRERQVEEVLAIIDRMRSYARTGGRKFTRDEMNER